MKHHLLLVDDNVGMIQTMAHMLEGLGRLRFATDGPAALRQMRETPPDLVLLDAEMPGMSGFQVCQLMKSDPLLAEIPVIFVTGHGETEFELRGLESGAVDFISKPVNEALLLARVRTHLRLKRLTDELRSLASTDALTGLANRRSFDETLQREWQRCARTGDPLSLVLIDVDHFKRYNDQYGHPAGDVCLRAVAQALAGAVQRPSDMAARIGGEEFALLLPQTDSAGACRMAQRAISAVHRLALPHAVSPTAPHVTISLGISVLRAGQPVVVDVKTLLAAADGALYEAKAQGRDRACVADLAGQCLLG